MNRISSNILKEKYSEGYTDKEIAIKYQLSTRDVCRLRRLYKIPTNPSYRKNRNILRHTPLTTYQKEFLYGSLFGDSCIATQESGTGYWICRHCLKQKDYLIKKTEILYPFISNISEGYRPFSKGGKLFPYISATSYSLPQFTELRKEFYPNNEKIITENIFKKLTPRSFSFWFFDDGSSNGHGFDITTFDPFFRNNNIPDLFYKVLNLKVSVRWQEKEGKIHIFKESHNLAWSYIKPELLSCFKHKIPRKYL